MKNLLAVCITTAVMLSSMNARAISEGYRKQLEREHKTQVQDTARPTAVITTYADDYVEVAVTGNCVVGKVNGFPAGRVKLVTHDTDEVATKMGVTLSVLKLGNNQCDITYSGSRSGILKRK